MNRADIENYNFSWQIVLSWFIGVIGVTNIIIVNIYPLELIVNSSWIYTIFIVYIFSFFITLDTAFREQVVRRKMTWIFISASSFLLFCKLVIRLTIQISDTYIIVGVFIFTILGLVVYFPKSIWSLGSTTRVICDILLLSFSLIALLQSGIYHFFGTTEPARSAASYSVWVGFEIAGLINTVFLWYHYRQRILGLIVLAAVCIVLADVTGTVRQWYPGIYRISGLPDISFNHIQKMVIMLFAYYSVDHFIDFAPDRQPSVSKFEWLYRAGVPRLMFIASVAMTLLVHPPDPWVTPVLLGVAVIQWVVSVNEEYRLFERLFQANRELTAANAELRTAQAQLRQAMLNAEELAVQEERRRLALEIHDGMGHHLTNAMRYLSLAAGRLERDLAKAKELFEIASEEVRKAHTDLLRSLDALTTADITTQPLETWLQGLVRECLYAGLEAELRVAGGPQTLPPNVQHALYRVAQEAVTNLQKYAQATSALLSVTYSPGAVELRIEDNGVGLSAPEGDRGRGLRHMRARIEHIGGAFQLTSAPAQGVAIRALVPLHGSVERGSYEPAAAY